jgi:hypothetical protein
MGIYEELLQDLEKKRGGAPYSGAGSVVDGGLDRNRLARLERGDSCTHFEDCTREFVTESDGYCFFGYLRIISN